MPTEPGGAVVVQRIGSCHVLHGREALPAEQIAWIGALRPEDDVTVALVMVAAAQGVESALTEVLEQMTGDRLLLAMSGAGSSTPGRPALARQIAEDWDVTVEAPDGDVYLAPGGLLFAGPSDPASQWWSFAPALDPVPLGPRSPSPGWDSADEVVSLGALELRPVPAGLLLRPIGSPRLHTHDVSFAVPVAPERPAILCAFPDDLNQHIPGAIALLAPVLESIGWKGLPPRLIPVNGTDLLPLGRALAEQLSRDVEVLSGFPVSERVLLTDAAGHGSWSPFIASVLCRPGSTVPTPLVWRPPVAGLRVVDPGRPEFALGSDWRVSLTRAGLWLHRPGAEAAAGPPAPVRSDTVRLDLGSPGAGLPTDAVAVLADLVAGLPAGIRARLLITVLSPIPAAMRAELAGKLEARVVLAEPGPAPVSYRSTDTGTGPALATRRSPAPESGPAPANHRSTPTEPGPAPTTPGSTAAEPGPALATRRSLAPESSPAPATRRSTATEREQVRAMIANRWDTHVPAVRGAFARLPALGAADLAAAAVDLVALSLFLTVGADDDLGPAALRSALGPTEAFRACLTSGLNLLPTYRGALLRGSGGRWSGKAPAPGTVLIERGPVGGTALTGEGEIPRPPASTMYVIWSQTARLLAPLRDERSPAGDVMFTPGTRFVVLDHQEAGPKTPALLFLQELPPTPPPVPAGPVALENLRRAIDSADLVDDESSWPAYALGPIGDDSEIRPTPGGVPDTGPASSGVAASWL